MPLAGASINASVCAPPNAVKCSALPPFFRSAFGSDEVCGAKKPCGFLRTAAAPPPRRARSRGGVWRPRVLARVAIRSVLPQGSLRFCPCARSALRPSPRPSPRPLFIGRANRRGIRLNLALCVFPPYPPPFPRGEGCAALRGFWVRFPCCSNKCFIFS